MRSSRSIASLRSGCARRSCEPAAGVVVLGELLGARQLLLDGDDEALGRHLEHAQLPRRVELVALEGADARQQRIVLDLAWRHAGEEALGQKRELDITGVEADEDERARAPQFGDRRAQFAVGERRLQRLVRPQQRLGTRRMAEELEHERQLAVRAQRRAVARGEQRRRDLVTHERALEPIVGARGHDAAERQRAETKRHLGHLAAVAGRRRQRRREAIAEPARDEAGGREWTRLQHRPDFAHVVRRQRGDEAREHVANGERAIADARPGAEDRAAGAQHLDERQKLVPRRGRHRRRYDRRGHRLVRRVGLVALVRLVGGRLEARRRANRRLGNRRRRRRGDRRMLRESALALRTATRGSPVASARASTPRAASRAPPSAPPPSASRADRSRRRCRHSPRRSPPPRRPAPLPTQALPPPATLPHPRARVPRRAPLPTPTRRFLRPRAPRWPRRETPDSARAGRAALRPRHPEPARPWQDERSRWSSWSMKPCAKAIAGPVYTVFSSVRMGRNHGDADSFLRLYTDGCDSGGESPRHSAAFA